MCVSVFCVCVYVCVLCLASSSFAHGQLSVASSQFLMTFALCLEFLSTEYLQSWPDANSHDLFPSMSPFFAILKSPFLLFSTMAFLNKSQLFYLTNICSLPPVCIMYYLKSLGRYQCVWWEGKKDPCLDAG